MNCPDALVPDVCPRCGGERAPSGSGCGSWVHFSKKPDRIVMTTYHYGVPIKCVLANGVVLRPKPRKQ